MKKVDITEKKENLIGIIKSYGSVLVAFSGGVDSSFLLKVAHDTLSEKAVAITAVSATYPDYELSEAVDFARAHGIAHIVVKSNELEMKSFTENDINRCYYCKSELFKICEEQAVSHGINYIADGSNCDDLNDFRPGRTAAKEFGIKSPLIDAALTKEEIRALSREMGLSTSEKPSAACLSSRFPYGTTITKERLELVRKCEEFLRESGIKQFRVRYHGNLARIEAQKEEIHKFLNEAFRAKVIDNFKKNGFCYVSLDLEGYRTGSQNETITISVK